MKQGIQSRIREKIQDLDLGDHAVCLYENETDRTALLVEAIHLAVARHQKILCVLDMGDVDPLARALEGKQIDAGELQRNGQLSYVFPDATERRHEGPDPLALLAFYETASYRATAQGYSGLLGLAVMDAFIPQDQNAQRLITYEAKVHTAPYVANSLFLCFYGMRVASPALLLEIIKCHAWIILGSRLNTNPFHLPPDVFLSVSRPEAEFAHAVQTLTATPLPQEKPGSAVVELPSQASLPAAAPAEAVPASDSRARLLELLVLCHETLIEGQSEKAMLADLCRHLVRTGGYRMAWAGTAGKPPARLIRSAAHAGEEADFLAGIQVEWTGSGAGPAGMAVKTGKPVALRRITTDPSCHDMRDQAVRRGYAAVACLPWNTDETVRGLLVLYATDPEAFGEDELAPLARLASHTGLALRRIRANGEQHRHDRQLLLPELILQTLRQPMLFLDADGRILYANAPGLGLFGFEREEDLVGRAFSDLAVKPEQAAALLTQTRQAGRAAGQFEVGALDSPSPVVQADTVAVCDELGRPVRLLVAFSHVTDAQERRRMEALEAERDRLAAQADRLQADLAQVQETAEAANRMKTDFLTGISHELRTPLNAVIGFSEVLLEPSFGQLNPKQTEYVTHILESGTHLQGLIDDILTLSKVETGNLTLLPGPVALRPLLDECLAPFGSRCENQGLSLRLMVADSAKDLTLQADGPKLKQIFTNLLSNAVKFTPEGGQILMTARTIASADRADVIPAFPSPYYAPRLRQRQPALPFPCLELTVSDTGIGIEPAFHDSVFAEFFQVRNSSRRKPPGTGLGLALTRRFVNMHGGQVWVESEGLNKGSRFVCILPLPPPHAP